MSAANKKPEIRNPWFSEFKKDGNYHNITDVLAGISENLKWIGAGNNANTEPDGSGPAEWIKRAIIEAGESIAQANHDAGQAKAAAIREGLHEIAQAIREAGATK